MNVNFTSSEPAAGTVIITGANGNLGTAVTKEFLDKRYKIIATVAAEAMRGDILAHENIEVVAVDLTDEAAAALFVQQAIGKYKTVDAALLLVGGFAMGNVEATSIADIYQQLSLNFVTAYNVARPVYKHMLQHNRGRIVFIGARPSLEAASGKDLVAYGLSKSLLFKLAAYMNEEAKGKDVVTTVVVPGTLDTALNRKSMPDANFDNWVKPEALAAILEFAVNGKSSPLREPILKAYNNA